MGEYVAEQVAPRAAAWVGNLQGHFTRDVAAVGDPCWVAIQAFSDTGTEELEWGPAVWQPSWGDSLPKRGDMAVIIFDQYRTPWVIAWVPSVYIPAGGGGGGSGDVRYTYTNGAPSTTWVITHNLGLFPAVELVDNSGNVIYGDIHYDSANQITVTFADAEDGKAYLS